MVELTQLRVASQRHTAKFLTLRGTIAYVQRGIRWMCKHWDYDGDYEFDDADDDDDATVDQFMWIPLSFATKKNGEHLTFFYTFLD